MDRRAFLLGAVATALPRPARAQWHRIGFISCSTTALNSPLLGALRQGLRERGYEEGRNLAIEYRFAHARDELPAMAAELVSSRVELILAAGSEGIVAAQKATATIPIVMTNSGDAVREVLLPASTSLAATPSHMCGPISTDRGPVHWSLAGPVH